MTYLELIANARECAKDALVHLDAAERLSDLVQRENACAAAAAAYGNLKTASEEMQMACDAAGENLRTKIVSNPCPAPYNSA